MRREARVSWFGLKTKVYGFSVVWFQNHWDGFPYLSLKIGSYGLMIWGSKSLRRFLDLGVKIKRAMVCQLQHRTDGRMKMALDWWRCDTNGARDIIVKVTSSKS
jgi:hypothetical protein